MANRTSNLERRRSANQSRGSSETVSSTEEDSGEAGLDQGASFEKAAVYYRPAARQICISQGYPDLSDRDFSEPDDEGEEILEALPGPRGGGKKQSISGFSNRSRRRLRRYVHAVPRDVECLFITLTYHETNPSPREAKDDLDAFVKRLNRAYPNASIIWKMEPQSRGVPHFHLLVYNCQYIPVGTLCEWWHTITDETSEAHAVSGVDIEEGVHSSDGKLQTYLAKYMNKEVADVGWENPGRFWGIRYRENLPLASWDVAWECTRAEAEAIIYALLDDWDVDLPEFTHIPSLTICTRGDPEEALGDLLDRV